MAKLHNFHNDNSKIFLQNCWHFCSKVTRVGVYLLSGSTSGSLFFPEEIKHLTTLGFWVYALCVHFPYSFGKFRPVYKLLTQWGSLIQCLCIFSSILYKMENWRRESMCVWGGGRYLVCSLYKTPIPHSCTNLMHNELKAWNTQFYVFPQIKYI